MQYIGIDPGAGGGLAFLTGDGLVIDCCKMPVSERDLLDALYPYGSSDKISARAILERAQATPQMGRSSAFSFGRGYGRLEVALTAALIPFGYVGAAEWQTVMGCRSHGDKNITKRRAQQLFPTLTVTHAIADALLLAEFCRRLDRGLLIPAKERTRGQKTEVGQVEGRQETEHPLSRRRHQRTAQSDAARHEGGEVGGARQPLRGDR